MDSQSITAESPAVLAFAEAFRDQRAEEADLADLNSIATFIGAIVRVGSLEPSQITPGAKARDLLTDSLEFLEIVDELQGEANVDLPTEAFDKVTNFGDSYVVFKRLALAAASEA